MRVVGKGIVWSVRQARWERHNSGLSIQEPHRASVSTGEAYASWKTTGDGMPAGEWDITRSRDRDRPSRAGSWPYRATGLSWPNNIIKRKLHWQEDGRDQGVQASRAGRWHKLCHSTC